jgi:hypothetical protein
MKTTTDTPLPPTDFFALPLQARAGLSATLRGQQGLALQSKKIGVRRHGHGPQKKKGLPAIQKSPTNAPSASPAEF